MRLDQHVRGRDWCQAKGLSKIRQKARMWSSWRLTSMMVMVVMVMVVRMTVIMLMMMVIMTVIMMMPILTMPMVNVAFGIQIRFFLQPALNIRRFGHRVVEASVEQSAR